jgi:hypothetical protein
MHRNHARFTLACTLAVTASILSCKVAGNAAALPAAQPGSSALPDQSVATNLPGTRAYLAPPAGFDPLAATDAQLAAYGFPPRPAGGSPAPLLAFWEQTVASTAQRLMPTLVQTSVFNGSEVRAPLPQVARPGNAKSTYSYNWSGYSVIDSARPFKNEEIVTQYTVPVAQEAFGTCTGGEDLGSAWDGIDGNGSNDVLQAGVEFDATCKGGLKSAFYAAWYEWFPYAEVRLGGFPVAPGDVMRIIVWNTSPTAGHALIVNFTANKQIALAFSAPRGTTLQGNSVEWIVERPEVGGIEEPVPSATFATLTNYVAAPFTDSVAFNTKGSAKYYYPGSNPTGTQDVLTMINNSGTPISFADLQGYWDLWFYDEGPAY